MLGYLHSDNSPTFISLGYKNALNLMSLVLVVGLQQLGVGVF